VTKKDLQNGIDEPKNILYNSGISCEAEITDENDLLESRGTGESPAGNDRSNGPPSAQGKMSILRRVVTVISRGMCWHFHKESDFIIKSGNKVAPREHRPCFGVSVETRAFLFAAKHKTKKQE
jgi:hypothetical protein